MKSAAPTRSEHLGTVELKIPSRAEWVAVARLAIAAIANRLSFSVDEIEDVKLAIAEGCTTCIEAASPESSIAITCEAASDLMRITVVGGPLGAVPRDDRPVLKPDDPRIDGLGIFLIESIMDEVHFTQDPQSGSRLVMTKRVGR